MRYAILSDVHANLEALTAVLEDARARGAERIVCAGDLVGYHADPEACVALLRARDAVCVAGNHDRVAAGLADPRDFGDLARRTAGWTRDHLGDESRAFLGSLPIARVVDARFLLVHGALHPRPNADLHLSSSARVRRSIEALEGGPHGVRLAFFGHTHRAAVHGRRASARAVEGGTVQLFVGEACLVNPGSVGQPRDGDPRAAYAIFDAEARAVSFVRVPFDRDACLAKAARAGLLAPAERRGLSGLVARLTSLARGPS